MFSHRKKAVIKFFPLQGGGSTSKDVFQNEMDLKEHFCLAIADSDKCFPNDGLGHTAEGLQNVYAGNPFNCGLYIMENVSEIENLIPLYILREYSDSTKKEFIDKGYDLSYYDIKTGQIYYKLFKDDVYNYWHSIITELDWDFIDQTRNSENYETYKSKIKSSCLPSLPNWGKDILSKILDDSVPQCYLVYDTVNDGNLSANQRLEWNRIGQLIYSWTCTSRGLRL